MPGTRAMGDSSGSNPANAKQRNDGQEQTIDETGPDTDRRRHQLEPFCTPVQEMQNCCHVTDVYDMDDTNT